MLFTKRTYDNIGSLASIIQIKGQVMMEYKLIEIEQAPEEIQEWIENNKHLETYMTFHTEEKTYVVIMRGEMMTGGYGIEVLRVDETDDHILIAVQYINPLPDQMGIQMISYPYVIIELDPTDKEIIIEIQK